MKRPEQLPIMQVATIAMIILHTKYRIGSCIEYNIIAIEGKTARKTLSAAGLKLATLMQRNVM